MRTSKKKSKAYTSTGEKSKPPPAAAAAVAKKEGEKEKSAPTSGRKKIQSAAMGLMSLMSPKEKSSVDGKEEEDDENNNKKKPEQAGADDDDAPPQLPPLNPMAFNNSYAMQQANFMNMESGCDGYGDGSGGGNRIMYPPPNMMDIHQGSSGSGFTYPPLNILAPNIPGPSNPSVHGGKSFPEILFEIVSNPDNQEIVSWLPHGQGFHIHNKQLFAKRILPECFDGAKFTSFTRRLKRWSFVRVSRGPELGAYYSKNFIRDQPDLVQRMRYRLNEEGVVLLRGGTHGVRKRGLPDERDVTNTIGSMRQVHDGILPQMPNQYQAHMSGGAVVYGNDGFPQLPKPSQLPKRDTSPRKNDGNQNDDEDKDGDSDRAKGRDKSSSPSEKKKSKIMYNFPSQYGADMHLQRSMKNGNMMQTGMIIKMGSAFGGSGMSNYPNADMSEMPKQMTMSSSQGGIGMGSGAQFSSDLFAPSNAGNFSMANNRMGGKTGTGSYERMGSLDIGGGNMMPKLGGPGLPMGTGGMQYCMPTDMPQGKMNSATSHKDIMDEARKGL